MKKTLLFVAAAMMLAVSCSMDDEVTERSGYSKANKEKTVFFATTESTSSPETKIYTDENLKVLWNENDCISIFNNANVNDKYMFDGEDGDNSGGFSFEEEGPEPSVPVELDHIYAVYPYSASTQVSVNNNQETITVDLPADQLYREHSFGLGANTMVAVTDGNFLPFKNVCGYLKFRFYGDNVTVKSIVFEGNNGEKIAGHAVITPSASALPTVAMQSDATGVITLNSPEGVVLGSTSATATEFIFVIPPTTFSNGFKVTVTDNVGGVFEKSSANSLTISRSKMESMSAMKVTPVAPPAPTATYTLVETQSDLQEGTYIIAAADIDVAMGALSSTYHTRVTDVTKSSDKKTIVLDDESTVIPIEITASDGKYVLKNTVSGKYLAYSGSGNTSTEQANVFKWTITINGDKTATIDPSGEGSRSIRYNNNSGQERFACYANTLKAVALYKKMGSIGISFEENSYELIKGTEDYLTFTGQTVTRASGDTRTVTYSISGSIGSINTSTGAVTLNGTTGSATVTATVGSDATYSAGSVSYSITVSNQATEYDLLDYDFIGVECGTGTYAIYASKSGLVGSSGRGAVYSTLTAGGSESTGPAVQMRTNNSNSGIVTTASGGNVTKIVLVWNSNTANGRTVQIYGKNSSYSQPSDLYDSNTAGTLLGELAKGSTTLTVTGSYKYIGIRSKDGALYLDEIRVYWQDASGTDPIINVTAGNPTYVAKEGGSQSISYSITNPVSGQSLSATSNASWISNVSVGTSTVTFNVAAQSSGSVARSGQITLTYNGAADVFVTVNQEAGEGGSQAAHVWLELPAQQTGSDYYNGVFKVGSARNYSYMYQYSTYTSMWTAYPLYASTMSSSEAIPGPYTPMQMASEEDRGQTWAANPNIEKSLQVNVWSGSYNVNLVNPPYVSDYYARGHQIPNADRSNNGSMQTQTYYATNSTPQIQNRFNGYIWGNLEDAVRESVKDTVYVATGPVFRTVGGSESITIIHPSHDSGKDVPVPNYYWKVLLKVKRTNGVVTSASAVGFWFEHKQYNSQDYTPYVKSVNQIEALTGLDFFVNLPDNLEETAEANTNWTTFKNF